MVKGGCQWSVHDVLRLMWHTVISRIVNIHKKVKTQNVIKTDGDFNDDLSPIIMVTLITWDLYAINAAISEQYLQPRNFS